MTGYEALKDRQAVARAGFKEGVIEQFRKNGYCSPVIAEAPDTGNVYVIFDCELIPMEDANEIIMDAIDALASEEKQ